MATSKSRKSNSNTTNKGKQKVEWRGYINWSPTEADRLQYQKWLETVDAIDNFVEEILLDGYSLKQSFSGHSGAFTSAFYCPVPGHENEGWCLSIFGKSPFESLCRLIFVHKVVLMEQWQSAEELQQNMDRW